MSFTVSGLLLLGILLLVILVIVICLVVCLKSRRRVRRAHTKNDKNILLSDLEVNVVRIQDAIYTGMDPPKDKYPTYANHTEGAEPSRSSLLKPKLGELPEIPTKREDIYSVPNENVTYVNRPCDDEIEIEPYGSADENTPNDT